MSAFEVLRNVVQQSFEVW